MHPYIAAPLAYVYIYNYKAPDIYVHEHLYSLMSLQANEPIDEKSFSALVTACTNRVAQKRINAHLIRDIAGVRTSYDCLSQCHAVTSMLSTPGFTEEQSRSWATSMQHSLAAQRQVRFDLYSCLCIN